MPRPTLPAAREALSGANGVPSRAWFAFFDQLNQDNGSLSAAVVLTANDQSDKFANSVVLTPVSGELERVISTTAYTLGLADTGIVADTYGDAAHTLRISFDDKGRATGASAIPLVTSNIAEGSNKYYTDDRARAALSGVPTEIAYDPTTGVIGLEPTGVTDGFYGDATHVPRLFVGEDGRVYIASSVAITYPGTSGYTGDIVVGAQTLHFANGLLGSVT